MVAGGEVVEVTEGWICIGGGVEWDGVVVMVRGDGDDYIGDDVGGYCQLLLKPLQNMRCLSRRTPGNAPKR
ncbi:hypothetical protein Tco_0241116 [Tanacetum coccineum]